jgi:thiol-disulfide isomerase/thioredoxin
MNISLSFRMVRTKGLIILIAAVIAFAAVFTPAQKKAPATPTGKTIFRDSDGNLISNNEFVDIRMANFHYPDATLTRILEDGTVEFRLQKVPQEGVRAPEFTVKTLDGATVNSAALRGRVVVLNFWFIGCAVCRAIKPALNSLKSKFADRDDIVFLAVTADPSGEVERYLTKEPFDYLQATDAGATLKKFVVGGFPKNIVISKTGEIIYWRSNVRAWDKFESVVRAQLAR